MSIDEMRLCKIVSVIHVELFRINHIFHGSKNIDKIKKNAIMNIEAEYFGGY